MDINTSGTVIVRDEYDDDAAWWWVDGDGTGIININGSPDIEIMAGWRGTDDGISIVNIDGDPCIVVAGDFKGADKAGEFYVNVVVKLI
jgi:hypothetical protein